MYAGLQRADDLLNYANQYLQLTRDSNTKSMEAVALRYQGQTFLQQGKLEDAKRSLDEAVAKLENLGSKLELGRALVDRSHTFQALEQLGMASEDRSRSQSIFEECGAVNGYNDE